MGRASDWLRDERRKTLGDWVTFCSRCGHARRYFAEFEAELETVCPACGAEMVRRCPACGTRAGSVFAVECEACGKPLRAATAFGGQIRRSPRQQP